MRRDSFGRDVSLVNGNGNELNTRQLGTQIIRSIQALVGPSPMEMLAAASENG